MLFSIIIPTLNEEIALKSNIIFLKRIRRYLSAELIVVDGGSKDSTVNLAKSLSCRVYITDASRSKQMNLGARHANGRYLVFLHADTTFDDCAINNIKEQVKDIKWGYLSIRFNSSELKYRILSYLINLRSKLFHYATGDQVMIIESNFFKRMIGFKEIDLMEDIELTNRMKTFSKPDLLEGLAITSNRRWRKYGYLKTILKMRYIRILYYLGMNDKILSKIYK
tara:strand:- start:614 stop:1285 length:672 start_codon:yes stop_codon:yes gene_type:complete